MPNPGPFFLPRRAPPPRNQRLLLGRDGLAASGGEYGWSASAAANAARDASWCSLAISVASRASSPCAQFIISIRVAGSACALTLAMSGSTMDRVNSRAASLLSEGSGMSAAAANAAATWPTGENSGESPTTVAPWVLTAAGERASR